MKHRSCSTWALAGLAGLALVASGCRSDDVSGTSDQQAETGVRESAPVVLVAVPMADGARTVAGELLGQVGTAAALSRAQAPAPTATVPTCNPTFDLGDGITGTCSVSDVGVATLAFSGTRSVDGLATTISGTLTVTVAADQPASGTKFAVALSATVSNTREAATWNLTGTAVISGSGQLTDHSLELDLGVTPTGGTPSSATVRLTTILISVFVQTPSGVNVDYVLDRTALTGAISVQGRQFATVTVANDCAVIHFVNPAFADATICRE